MTAITMGEFWGQVARDGVIMLGWLVLWFVGKRVVVTVRERYLPSTRMVSLGSAVLALDAVADAAGEHKKEGVARVLGKAQLDPRLRSSEEAHALVSIVQQATERRRW